MYKIKYICSKWAQGFLIATILFIIISVFSPTKTTEVKVPVPVHIIEQKIIEKPVIKKVPMYISANDKQQIMCLAKNAYFEAGNQSTKGKIAVTNVVMNRTEDSRFPSTPCGVIRQKNQFSWVGVRNKITETDVYKECLKVAEQVYIGNIPDVTRGAKFYHATYVRPNWGYTKVAQIGAHIFYRG